MAVPTMDIHSAFGVNSGHRHHIYTDPNFSRATDPDMTLAAAKASP